MDNQKKTLSFLGKHLIIVVTGVVLALLFSWIAYEGSWMETSILSLQERAKIRDLHRDAAYKKVDHTIEVFISESLYSSHQLFISFLHNPSDLTILTGAITSPYQWELMSGERGQLLIKVSGVEAGDIDEGILIVPYSGEDQDITLEFVSPQALGHAGVAVGKL